MTMQIVDCGLHGFHETLGIDEDSVYVHWSLTGDDAAAAQTAYQIDVHLGSIFPGKRIWTSGRVISPKQRNVLCKPDDGFAPTSSYWWTVTIWDQNGHPYESSPNFFFTAYPHSKHLPPWSPNHTYMPHDSLIFRTWFENPADRWKAVWIGDGTDKPIYLRKSLTLSRQPVRAIALASGLGHFNLTVNGTAASNHVLDPGWTDYHRTVQFVAYDLTDHLRPGANALGAHVGNGFYAGDQGDRFFWPCYEDNTYVRHGNELCFFCELHLFYEDGQHDYILSGPDWRVHKSATMLANIYSSETHDFRLQPSGWDTPQYDDSTWQPAKPVMGPRGALRYQSQPPLTLQETFLPKQSWSPRPGVVVHDLGQNSSVMVKVSLLGQAASEVMIRCMETIDADGSVCMPDALFKDFETKVYNKLILAGTSEPEVWQPAFSFTSARYIQLEGVSTAAHDALPRIQSVIGQHVSSSAPRLGSMKTDKDDVNQLINMCYWSFVSNLFSYHTDCPQVEKFGWLEVTHLLFPATQYIRDIESLHSKILQDILDAQEPSGFIPNMVPETRFMCGPLRDTITWGCAICLIPDYLKRYYGSTRMIQKAYPAAKRYMEYISTKERHGGLIEHGLGDWGRGIAFGNSQANIETAVYYKCLGCCETMARQLGRLDEAQHFQREAKRIYSVYNKYLLISDDPQHPVAYYTSLDNFPARDHTAVNQAVALQFGLVPPAHIADVQAVFLADVADGRIRAGEIGLPLLFRTLQDLDRPDIVLQMARQEEHPSYMRFIRRGETTLSEFWQDECRSKCHDMLGTIYEWLYASVLGIRTLGDAYETFEIAPPYTSEFQVVEGSVKCPFGVISTSYSRNHTGKISLAIGVPFGTQAVLRLPPFASSVHILRKGGQRKTIDPADLIVLDHGQYTVDIDAVREGMLSSAAAPVS